MAEIVVSRNHPLNASDAKDKLSEMGDKLKSKFGVDLEWNGHRADIKGMGVKGSVQVDDGTITITVKLGLALRMLKGTVESQIETMLDKEIQKMS